MDIVQIDGIKTSSITSEGRVLEVSGVVLGISTSDSENTSLAIFVHAIAELVVNLSLVHQILQRRGTIPLRVASETHHTINHLELHEVARLVSDGTKRRGACQTTQIEAIHIHQTRYGTGLVGIGHHTSLVRVGEGTILAGAAEAIKVETRAWHRL